MADNLHDWSPLVDDVQSRKDTALGMGGPDRIARQRELGKLPVRERLDILLDKGSFVEYGALADHMDPSLAARGRSRPTVSSPASGASTDGASRSSPTTSP